MPIEKCAESLVEAGVVDSLFCEHGFYIEEHGLAQTLRRRIYRDMRVLEDLIVSTYH